jgi:8-oxo-dGTP pyrophosphatase MutT (NUDIX family)
MNRSGHSGAISRTLRSLPPALAEQAGRFVPGTTAEVVPRAAATVALLRDGHAGLEVYVIRRARSMAFAAGMYAFPGGAVDERDTEAPPGWAGPPPSAWARRLHTASEAEARAVVCAAIRETYEEAGVLFAAPAGSSSPDMTDPSWEADRLALMSRRLALVDFVGRRGLLLRTDLLAPWAHWITPRFEARRYDTRFFLAVLPPGQEARDVSGEAEGVAWLAPEDALTRLADGEISMLPPTAVTLHELSGYATSAEALSAANIRTIRPITPEAVIDGDDVRLVLPDDLAVGEVPR